MSVCRPSTASSFSLGIPHGGACPSLKVAGTPSTLFPASHRATCPRRQTLGNKVSDRNAERFGDQNHFMIGYPPEKSFDLGNACTAKIEAFELAFPRQIGLCPRLFDTDVTDVGPDNILRPIVAHQPVSLPGQLLGSAHKCVQNHLRKRLISAHMSANSTRPQLRLAL